MKPFAIRRHDPPPFDGCHTRCGDSTGVLPSTRTLQSQLALCSFHQRDNISFLPPPPPPPPHNLFGLEALKLCFSPGAIVFFGGKKYSPPLLDPPRGR